MPGIWSKDQITAWKEVTESVHKNGSLIYMQLWALGRAAGAEQLTKELGPDAKVVSASDVPFEGGAKPTPLTEEEIYEYIKLYAQAAKNAVEAGFDGVEIHSANGYLPDQFLQDKSNFRTDAWGGNIEKRARFGLEVTKAVVEAIGSEKTGIRLSPYSKFQGMKMDEPKPQFEYYVKELKKLNLAYLHIVTSRVSGNADVHGKESIDDLVDIWADQSPVLLAGGFTPEHALTEVGKHKADVAIVFGRHFISNPDLVFRVKEDIKFTDYDRDLFYNKKQAHGYTDWEFSKEFQNAKL